MRSCSGVPSDISGGGGTVGSEWAGNSEGTGQTKKILTSTQSIKEVSTFKTLYRSL